MPSRPTSFHPRGPRHERQKATDLARGSARERGYTTEWDKASRLHLQRFPFCEYCERGAFGDASDAEPATLVDHLYPHKGDRLIFWATRWWVSCCTACHSGPKQALERQSPTLLDNLARLLGRPIRS